jgi:hypothetical protein
MNANFYINGLGCRSYGQNFTQFLQRFKQFDPSPYLPAGKLRRVSKTGRVALEAACQAAVDAQLPWPLPDELAPRVGLYVGTAFGVIDNSLAFMDSICDLGARLASPAHFSHSVNNAYCGFISLSFNIQGPSCTVCQSALSFAGALQTALTALREQIIDFALVGAVEQDYAALYKLRQKNPTPPSNISNEPCAVFFLLSGTNCPRYPKISMPAWLHKLPDMQDAVVISKGLPGLQRFYAGHPSELALDIAAACTIPASEKYPEKTYLAYAHRSETLTPYTGVVLECL